MPFLYVGVGGTDLLCIIGRQAHHCEGVVALQVLGCIDFSDARRRRGVVVKTDR